MYKLIASVVIFNNKIEEIEDLIKKFHTKNLNQKLVIIDNSKTKGIKEEILKINTSVDYIESENIGYGRANNIAIKKYAGQAEYFIIMNPDIKFDVDSLEKLINFADEKKNFGIIMPKICNEDNEVQYLCKLLPKPTDLLIRRFFNYIFFTKKTNYNYECRFSNYDRIINVPFVSGCFMFCNYNNLVSECGFDSLFFMYLEDVDLSRRMYKYGNYYFPEACVFHLHKKESFKSIKMTYEHVKSAIKYFNKWGWIFDTERKKINCEIMKKYKK